MQELTLTRVFGDRRLYTFDGIGSLRLTGWGQRTGVAEAGGRRWEIAPVSFWRREIRATDMTGAVVGEFAGRGLRGGRLRWHDQDFELRRGGFWRQRYTLAGARGELATVDGRSWGRRPVTVTGDALTAIDPGLLLFVAFVVRALAVAAAAAAAS